MCAQELTDRFRVIFMCTGNQARSVLAEHYFRKITGGLPVDVESCGTMDIPSSPALPEAIEAGKALALDLGGHSSRCYTAVDLKQVDLVIGFDQNHVATAVVDGGADPDKTFKLLELVRLLKAQNPGEPRKAIETAATARRNSGFTPEEDVRDPAGRSDAVFRDTASIIKKACDEIAAHLFRYTATEKPLQPDKGRDLSAGARIWD